MKKIFLVVVFVGLWITPFRVHASYGDIYSRPYDGLATNTVASAYTFLNGNDVGPPPNYCTTGLTSCTYHGATGIQIKTITIWIDSLSNPSNATTLMDVGIDNEVPWLITSPALQCHFQIPYSSLTTGANDIAVPDGTDCQISTTTTQLIFSMHPDTGSANANSPVDYTYGPNGPRSYAVLSSTVENTATAQDKTRISQLTLNLQPVLNGLATGANNTTIPVSSIDDPIDVEVSDWVADKDWSDNSVYMELDFLRNNNTLIQTANFDLLVRKIVFPISSTHPVDVQSTSTTARYLSAIDISPFSSTTPDYQGRYKVVAKIRTADSTLHRVLSWWGLGGLFDNSVLYQTESYFVIGTTTAYDNYVAQQIADNGSFVASTTLSAEAVKSYCAPTTSFDVANCMRALFIPNTSDLSSTAGDLTTNVLSKAPVGYFTRLVSILAGNTGSTTLPVVSVGMPDPVGGTTTIDMDAVMSQALDIENSVKDPRSGKTAKDIFTPVIEFIVALNVIIIIFHDITGNQHVSSDTGGSGFKVSREQYRYKEKLYSMSRRKR